MLVPIEILRVPRRSPPATRKVWDHGALCCPKGVRRYGLRSRNGDRMYPSAAVARRRTTSAGATITPRKTGTLPRIWRRSPGSVAESDRSLSVVPTQVCASASRDRFRLCSLRNGDPGSGGMGGPAGCGEGTGTRTDCSSTGHTGPLRGETRRPARTRGTLARLLRARGLRCPARCPASKVR
jgi:hypothetical protein